MMFRVLVIGHLLGDFFFQSKKLAEKKAQENSKLALHCGIYFITILLVAGSFVDKAAWGTLFSILLGVSILHGIIDVIKINLEKKSEIQKYILFITDQILHIGLLYFAMKLFDMRMSDNCLAYMIVDEKIWDKVIPLALAGIICWRPTSVFISTVFRSIPNTVLTAEDEEVKIGSWIGILEREIILILGIMNQFGAIGFVLTAKSLARYKQLENKAFAEKYLVGTLLSAVIALLAIILC